MLAFLSVLISLNFAAAPPEVRHKVVEGETVWFLADLYFGDPEAFDEILEDNNLKDPKDLMTGQTLRIVEPEYYPAQPYFTSRYEGLIKKRSAAQVAKKKLKASILSVISQGASEAAESPSKQLSPTKDLLNPRSSEDRPLDRAKEELRK